MAVGDAYVFPGFLTPVLIQLFFPKPPTTFLTCFCRGERRKYAGKKSRLDRGSNSQPPGHESATLTTEPPGWGLNGKGTNFIRVIIIINPLKEIVRARASSQLPTVLKFCMLPVPTVLGVSFNSLPDDKILDWSKLKQIADDILKCIGNEK